MSKMVEYRLPSFFHVDMTCCSPRKQRPSLRDPTRLLAFKQLQTRLFCSNISAEDYRQLQTDASLLQVFGDINLARGLMGLLLSEFFQTGFLNPEFHILQDRQAIGTNFQEQWWHKNVASTVRGLECRIGRLARSHISNANVPRA
ncbi:hypothetical protein PVAG01_07546 [Phlyctema vagabunda]|uniref:Uncharacterized protein n=1 Tax=Phlyctema vagabunda TaxID=108571 RepID=A0ABR4PDH7_9HELO